MDRIADTAGALTGSRFLARTPLLAHVRTEANGMDILQPHQGAIMKLATQLPSLAVDQANSAIKFSKSFVLSALLLGASLANAAADFTTIRRSQADLSDTTPSLVVNFTLPSTVNLSSSTSNSAVLDLEALQSEFNYNEVYINPPTTVCTSDATDANQAGSIGFLIEHDDTNAKTEWAANHKVFSSALLRSGSNTLMICIRSLSGEAGPNVGNLDNVSVRGIVLHYHTTP